MKISAKSPKRRRKYSQEESQLHSDCRKFFEDFYLRYFKVPFYWQGKDASAVVRILGQIRFLMQECDRNDNKQLSVNFQAFVTKAYLTADTFTKDHFNLPLLSSKFNEIYLKIKNGRKQHQNARDDEQSFLDELERRYDNGSAQ